MTKPVELPKGTLEMLILKAVSLGPLHGYGILLRIQQISGERLEILQGSFYTAIYRLEGQGWIKGVLLVAWESSNQPIPLADGALVRADLARVRQEHRERGCVAVLLLTG